MGYAARDAGARRQLVRLLAAAGLAVAGCAQAGPEEVPPDRPEPTLDAAQLDAGGATVRGVFELDTAPMAFGSLPFPDDLYMDSEGRVAVADLPGPASARDYRRALEEAFADLDGFGLSPTVYFPFDGTLDPESLPATAEASVGVEPSVFLLDVDPSSARAFERIPAIVSYQAEHERLALRPAPPHLLTPGRRYAAVVTRAVRAEGGGAIDGAERFVAIRDPDVMLTDSLELAARAHYTPVLETLASEGVPRDQVAALAVFTVQGVGADLADARAQLRAEPPPVISLSQFVTGTELDEVLGSPPPGSVGLDAEGGASHRNVGAMIHGSLLAPNLISDALRTHGSFTRAVSGELEVKRSDEVYFTLWLPRGSSGALPVAVFQHGLDGDRSDALPVAEELLGRGYAVIALDAPFHGLRSGAGDMENRFTGTASPDGFGDESGDFAGAEDREGELQPLHPFYLRDAVRQGTVDLMSLVYVLAEGDWSALENEPEMPIEASLDSERIVLLGVDLGAEMAVMLTPHEPSLGAVVLAFSGGLRLDAWFDSPARFPLRDALLERLGRASELDRIEPGRPCPLPDLDAVRTLLGRGNALAHSRAARRTQANMMLLLARNDEVVNNRNTEALAFALGAESTGEPQYVPALPQRALAVGDRLSGNFAFEDALVTRALSEFDPATHDMLTMGRGRARYEHPLEAPFAALSEPMQIDNPIGQALETVAFFFESWRACKASSSADETCAASVMAFAGPE